MSKLARILSGLLMTAIAFPALAQVTDADIDRARAEVNRITDESAELGQAVIEAYGRQSALDSEIERLRTSIEFAQIQITETEVRLEELAVELYMGSTSGVSLSVLFSATDQEYPAGIEYLREVSGVDEGVIDQLRAFRTELDRQTGRLAEALEEQQVLATELEALATELQGDLIAAQEVYDRLVAQQQREEEERRRREEERRRREAAAAAALTTTTQATTPTTTAVSGPGSTTTSPPATTTSPPPPPPSSGGGGTCPVAGAVSFTDSWGAPRSGGRTHKGVDMIAARGTPIVAIYSGTIYRLSNSSLGGKSVYFTSDAGDLYYYAHLDEFGDIAPGQQVAVGYVIGYNGSTGNAPSWLPHLHFEYHPGGGAAVNPYPLVKSLCG
ncbi:MAG TPA: peptidoglycan DD-metalloendopeptidase family protein [Acidimicrobiia bacterium]|nr:peptidoglycan DD-metalloendopeptidase family protein [Acidimicrobiia bacterium]